MTTRLAWIASLAFIATLAGCASHPTNDKRAPAGTDQQDETYQNAAKALLPAGTHSGVVPGTSQTCRIDAAYGMNFAITGQRSDFNPEKDRASETCMYSQACFALSGNIGLSPKVVELESNEGHLHVRIQGDNKVPMSLEIERKNDTHAIVTIQEGVGVMHMLTTQVVCEISN